MDTLGQHCKSKIPIFIISLEDGAEDENGYYQRIQSSEMCTICVMADACDKSKMYAEVFSDFYNYMESLYAHGIPASECGLFLHPFKICYTSDLKATWMTSRRGGDCKNANFCHLCSATKHDLVSWNEGGEHCDRCIAKNKNKMLPSSIL